MTPGQCSSTVYPVTNGIPFLGFHIFPTHVRLKRRNGVAFAKRYRKHLVHYQQGILTRQQLNQRVRGWVAHAQFGDTWQLRKSLLRHPLPKQNLQQPEETPRYETIPHFFPGV